MSAAKPATPREVDILVYGATGFTGRLVVGYLQRRYADSNLTWGIGGRNADKLEQLARDEGIADSVTRYVADSTDHEQLREIVGKARVVLTTVGPYAKYGSEVVAACAELGVDYCDLTGEVYWMRRMIDAHEETARASGARIVHTCGFDSVPSDIGTYFIQKATRERYGEPATHVKFRASEFKGGVSGGTLDSMWTMLEQAARDPSIGPILADPYALNPKGTRGLDGLDHMTPSYDTDFGAWIAPFVMGSINTRVVRRSNALLDFAYGTDFRYDEATLLRPGPLGFLGASATGLGLSGFNGAASIDGLRGWLRRMLPKPGEGPSAETMENGRYTIELLAKHPRGALRGRVRGDRDPGYGSTSKMLAECAVALAQGEAAVAGGFWTPASALGEALLERLPANAGVTFDLV